MHSGSWSERRAFLGQLIGFQATVENYRSVVETRRVQEFDIHPASVLKDDYGFDAANRPTIVVDAADVPEDLRFLIPQVERWAIPLDEQPEDVEQWPEAAVHFMYLLKAHSEAYPPDDSEPSCDP